MTESAPALERKADTGKRIVVCGSGPAGLAAAYFLGLAGNSVTVLEPGEAAGGFLCQAKAEQLPPEVLAKEIERLAQVAGVKIETQAALGSTEGMDLVVVDAGAHAPDSAEAQAVLALVKGGPEPLVMDAGGGFKASQVAHALALGREAANQAQESLGLPAVFAPPELGPGGHGGGPHPGVLPPGPGLGNAPGGGGPLPLLRHLQPVSTMRPVLPRCLLQPGRFGREHRDRLVPLQGLRNLLL